MGVASHPRTTSKNPILTASGKSIEQRNKWGQTPLMLAARSGDESKVKAVLAAGGAVKAADDEGSTALSMSIAGDAPV